MITHKNIATAKVDFSKLPKKFKEDFEDIKAMAEYYDADKDLKEAVDKYVGALNAELGKAKPKAKAPKKTTKGFQPLVKIEKVGSNYSIVDALDGRSRFAIRFESRKEAVDFINESKDLKLAKPTPKAAPKSKAKAKKSSNKRSQSKDEAAKAKKAYEADKRKAIAGEFANLSQAEVIAIGRKVHANRLLSAQIVDETADHKKRLTPTPENLVRWMKEPGKFDLIGVDNYKLSDPTADLRIKKEIFWARLLKK